MTSFSFHPLFLIWLIGTTLLSAVIVKAMARIGVMDNPIERSSHTIPTPKGGGVGIISAFLIGSIIIFPLLHQPYLISISALLGAVAFLSIISWLDDVKQWSAIIKLAAQILCATIITLFIPSLSLLQQSYFIFVPVIILGLVYVTNAFNFMDGLNGLAAGVAAISCLFFYYQTQQVDFALIAIALFCGLMGFLPFNYPKAEIFMGDVGSQSCGLLLAAFAIAPFNKLDHVSITTIPSETILIFFLLFGILYDVTFTLIRRTKEKAPLLKAHRSHLYQMAHRCQIPASIVTIIEWLFCIWGGMLALFIPLTTSLNTICAYSLLIIPQLIWTLFILYKTRQHDIKKW
ncbi:UDP-N-acetylmuramyl pentapeptide phosphotransferase/UDP-N-acetylglucosamine-1-phosphate transferase (Rfe) (PDB:4J72) [Commensalibacter communis]|uniref:glycosyltransferase family 4 protein n=1 Tax=Commensalibacter communis TaxID=2972786 RepID=UPI0022FF5E8C|nr:UDP-phosphate alpha-N-acetylglucosaminephosphotransferase [Commensalibacter communis]CAI3946894.1 UDP-N-acetylmuramyl pentapeptide phosphotransferase/UDP-N-acetylglucosamine-1-phosphate transferase (Rfe) (PDB:4J72) [Commensalibacter communis]CAI3948210.1 UDP-N-acetylmuramyl pentapeptide phosphotransferase/UDP-N-acetylglucosamine-1-phosphate transferase (Rfe) (PDB:4J72) [Commensalibacter communis]